MAGQPKELYGSHLPLLTRLIDVTSGPVLELGMGLYSTPLLHTMCQLQVRPLVSLDNDPKWYEENKKWQSELHLIAPLVTDWDESLGQLIDAHWSVVFVDQKPAKKRIEAIKHFANNANFIVIHDSEPESNKYFRYNWIYPLFTYRYDYTKLKPHTTILSNYVDPSFLV